MDIISILGFVFIIGILFFMGLVFLYIFLRKGNVKVQVWRVNEAGEYIERKLLNGFYNEKEKELNIYKGLIGNIKVPDFPSSTIKADKLIDVIEYNGEYIPAYFNVEKQNELRAIPLLDPARQRAFAERIIKNKLQTSDFAKQQLFQWVALGLLGLLIIGQIVTSHFAYSNLTSAVKDFRESVNALNAKIIVQPQVETQQQDQQNKDNKPPA